ncbi:MAG: hypothetical protein ACREU0_04285 [Burkholderiales bacterium]
MSQFTKTILHDPEDAANWIKDLLERVEYLESRIEATAPDSALRKLGTLIDDVMSDIAQIERRLRVLER